MARTWIPLAAAESAGLPPLCARTGAPADRLLVLPARARAGWTWWLLPLGLLPFLAARHLAPSVTVLLPLSARAAERLERMQLVRLLALVEATGLAAAGVLSHRRDALLAGAAFLAGAVLVRAVEAASSVRASLDPSARGVLLSGVHPAFRDAVDHLQRQAWTQARPGSRGRPLPAASPPGAGSGAAGARRPRRRGWRRPPRRWTATGRGRGRRPGPAGNREADGDPSEEASGRASTSATRTSSTPTPGGVRPAGAGCMLES